VNTSDVLKVVPMEHLAYAVTFNVNDGTTPVAGADIIVGATKVTTDDAGQAVFTDLLPGDYTYSVSATGFGDVTGSVTITAADVSKDIVLLSDVGINKIDKGTIKVYPNPTSGNLFVSMPENTGKEVTIRITNIIGTVIIENKVVNSSGQIKLDVSGLDNGVYFVNISGSGNKNTLKVVKK
jgi:hypothetical protein